MNRKTITEYIRALDHIKGFMQNLLEEEDKIIPPPSDYLSEITDLRILSKTDNWPDAVPPDLLCGEDETSKLNRAGGIIREFIVGSAPNSLRNKKFLDFGCGEGHVAYVADLFDVQSAVGYDVEDQDWSHFEPKQNLLFTTNWEKALNTGPFDVILANDVLDHSGDPLKALFKIQAAKASQGKVIIRCHPWASRHGTHLYKQQNKAYLHLVFTSSELSSMGLSEIATVPTLDPIAYYQQLFKDAGFTIVKEDIINHPLELFFWHNPLVLRRIKEKWKTSTNPELANGSKFPRDVLEIQFVDYVLV